LRGFVGGLIVGLVVGGAGTYAALEKPWKRHTAEVESADAGAPVTAEPKSKKRRKKRRKGKSGTGAVDEVDTFVELSAADRQLVWKGPAVRLPPKDVDFGGDSGRTLEQGEIDSGIASGASAVSKCIGDARGNAELTATITLQMLVDPDGRVSARRVQAPRYLQENGLFGCISKATTRMRFAAVGAHTLVSVPFELD